MKKQDKYARQTFEFLGHIQACKSSNDISNLVIKEMTSLGYEYVTCWTLPAPGQPARAGVLLNTRPEAYVDRYVKKNYVTSDPAVTRLRHSLRPFSLGDLRQSDALSKNGRVIIDEAREFGINDGLVVPIVTIGGSLAIFSPCGEDPDLSPRARSTVEILGIYGHQALKRGVLEKFRCDPSFKSLTPREREILQWVAYGKSDDEIGEILSISRSTVKHHVEHSKYKLGVYKRTSAIVIALSRGEITL